MGFFDGFADMFNGGKQRDTIAAGDARARGDAQAGLTAATNATNTAVGYLNPYAQQGQRANALYGDATGANGQPAYRAAMQGYAGSDPFRDQNADYANNALMRQYAARGLSGGNTGLAVARAQTERGATDWNAYLSRLQGQGQMGFQAASGQAGLQGQNAGYQFQNGQNMAGLSQQTAGAIAGTQNAGVQNALGFGGMLINGFSPTKDGTSAFGNMAGSVNKLFGRG